MNSFASFGEALTNKAYFLLKTFWKAWREGQAIQCGQKLRTTVSALLLLRGASEDEDVGLTQRLMAASFLDGIQHTGTQASSTSSTPSRVGAAEALPEPGRIPGYA